MIDVRSKRCEIEGCMIRPSFNYRGQYPAIRCSNHSCDDMVDINTRKCSYPECEIEPSYNIPGSTISIYCRTHKLNQMVDIKTKKCKHSNCKTCAKFNYPGTSVGFCEKHRTKTMIKNPRKRCSINGCTDIATHGTAPDKPTPFKNYATHCDFHTTKDLQDLHNKLCVNCTMPYLLNFNSKCYFCDKANFELKAKRKETRVKEYFDLRKILYSAHDKVIDGGKYGRERPDFIFYCGSFVIIVEVDENQHFSRPCECEQIRMVNIFQSVGLPTIFIRYNPDKYLPEGRITKIEGDSSDKRMVKLEECIRKTMSTPPVVPLSVKYLYFDGWNGVETVDPITVLSW